MDSDTSLMSLLHASRKVGNSIPGIGENLPVEDWACCEDARVTMKPHRIHLRGPWEFAWTQIEPATPHLTAMRGTVAMPCEWRVSFGETSGTVVYSRKFHRPTNLEPHERVNLLLTEVRGEGSASLNERSLGRFVGEGNEVRFDVTSALNPFNLLQVEVKFEPPHSANQPGGLFGVVALEIESTKS